MTPARVVVFWYVMEARAAARRWRRLRSEPGWERLTRESALAQHEVLGPVFAELRGAVKAARIGHVEGVIVEATRAVADAFATEWQRRPVETGWVMCLELVEALAGLGGLPVRADEPTAEPVYVTVAEEVPRAVVVAAGPEAQMGLFA